MPLSWVPITEIEPDREYVVIATRFGVKSRGRMPHIFSAADTLISSFTAIVGLVGYSLRANVLNSSLWTLSAWNSGAELRQFVGGPAHGLVMKQTVKWMESSRFVTWTSKGSELPTSWSPVESLMQDGGHDGRSFHQEQAPMK
jgi:hypothetical protein